MLMTLRSWRRQGATVRERQLDTIRRLIGYAEVLAEHICSIDPGSHEREYLFDTIMDGESLLKQLGGSAIR